MTINFQEEFKRTQEEDYKDLCEYWLSVRRQLVELEEKEAKLKQELIAKAGGERKSFGVAIKLVERKGSIDYQSIPYIKRMSDEKLNEYRKESMSFYKVLPY